MFRTAEYRVIGPSGFLSCKPAMLSRRDSEQKSVHYFNFNFYYFLKICYIHVRFLNFREMGAADSKTSDATKQDSGGFQQIFACCSDCKHVSNSTLVNNEFDEYEKWARGMNKPKQTGSHLQHNEDSGRGLNLSKQGEPPAERVTRSKSISSSPANTPSKAQSIRRTRTIVTKLPEGWDESLVNQLQTAVEETAREGRIKVPGNRDMNELLAARAVGKRVVRDSPYGVRHVSPLSPKH
jgi:hypothetical protein